MPRLFPIAILVAVASLGSARAQEKPKSEPEAQQPRSKAADHATEGEEQGASGLAAKEKIVWPGMTRAGTVVLPNGWSLKPAGRQVRLGDLPVQIAVHPSEPILAILHAGYGEHEVVTASATTGKIIGRVSLPSSFSGLVWSHNGKRLFVGGGFDDKIYRFEQAEGLLSKKNVLSYPRTAGENRHVPAGLVLSKDGKTLYAAAAFGHSVGRFDAESGAFRDEIALDAGSYPYGLALDESHNRLYVSLWSKARVAVVDTQAFALETQWAAQEHPNEMLLAHGGKFLFVANANRNTVTVIDTEAGKAIETIGTAIDPKAPPGSTPSSLALSADESLLLVSNANTNNLAVVNVKDPGGAHRWASSRRGGTPPRCGCRETASRSSWPTAREEARGPTATALARDLPAGAIRCRNISAGSFRGRCRSSGCRRRGRWLRIPRQFTSAVRSSKETRRP